MRILRLTEVTVDQAVKESLDILKKGGVVAYPTESFYGLGVRINDKAAVERLFRLKNRPMEKAMPVIVGNEIILKALAKSIPKQAEKLMKQFWPGPLTIIFEAVYGVNRMLTGGKDRIAVRIPGESFALHLARGANFPLTATSANPSGQPPAQEPGQITDYFADSIDLIIDGGKTPGGKPSTIIDFTITPPKVSREGSLSSDLLI